MNKKLTTKNKLIISFITTVAVMTILYGIILLIPYLLNDSQDIDNEIIIDYDFYPVDYSENIFEDEEYLKLISNGFIGYDDNINFIYDIDKDTAAQHGKPVKLLVDMIYSIVNGDYEGYNSFFSEAYFEKNQPKAPFTMQKVYDVRITYFSTETITKNKQNEYTEYTYKLTYKIYENNGTFRKDIGDGYRVQYITISDRENKFKIDSIVFPVYK